ncbi:hypothetical protein [Pantoea ananatis]|uniref:hypothetical protein n=1 Tax=Pantoea ananas TaxID=553 RepID=UPI00299F5FE7|nr:hypothetical protein [Pantoea ananatis]
MVSLMLTLSVLNAGADDSFAPENSLTAGLAANDAPRYSGAKRHHWQAVPVIQWRAGLMFLILRKGQVTTDRLKTAFTWRIRRD